MKIKILGGGLSGCAIAYLLKNKYPKYDITIIEKEDIGGLCRTYSYEGISYELGPHILFTHREDLKKFFELFLVNKEKLFYQYISVDGTLNNLHHFPVTIDDVVDINKNAARELYKIELSKPDYTSLESFLLTQVGRTAYEYFFKNYNIKQWGIHPRKMETNWAKQRGMYLRNEVSSVFGKRWQGHPGSYNKMFNEMIKDINIIQDEVISVDFNNQYIKTRENQYEYDFIFNTTSLDSLILQKNILKYRGIYWVYVLLDTKFALPSYLVSFPNNYNFTRIMEYKHASQQNIKETLLGFEFPYDALDDKDPSEDVFIKEALSFVNDNLTNKVESYFTKNRRLTYPIAEEKTNKDFLNILESSLYKNFITLGRLGLYSYISMDTCIDQCFQVMNVFEKWNNLTNEEKMSFYNKIKMQQT